MTTANMERTGAQDETGRSAGQGCPAEASDSNGSIQALQEELARSNAELRQFASVLSHDLRSPLMTIDGYMHMLTRRLEPYLDEESIEMIGYVRESVRRMRDLMNGLLAHTRLAAQGIQVAPCNCETLLKEVLDGLQADLQAAEATVTHDPLPTVPADRGLLAQVFRALIDNGLKFHGQAPPRVHVRASEGQSECVFSVQDNGIGIDPRDFDKLFRVFRRLHPDDSGYPGLGLGLATCKKIIELHGGRIWVESRLGEGSTFHFALPRQV